MVCPVNNIDILDLNGDGKIDLTDYALLLADTDKTGIYRSDIASLKNQSAILGFLMEMLMKLM